MSAVKKGQNLLPHSLIQILLTQETPVSLNLRVALQQGSAQGPELAVDMVLLFLLTLVYFDASDKD